MAAIPAAAPERASETLALATFASQGGGAVTARHRAAVADLLTDTVGVAVAGMETAPVRAVRGWLAEEHGEQIRGEAAVWGREALVSPSDAALINGTAAHALDWDEAAPAMPMHPAVVLLPALLAVASREPVGGEDLVRAFCVGASVIRAVTAALPSDHHYSHGWHTTATVGRIAAVAAVGNLLRRDPAEMAAGLGLATSLMAGSRANFGTGVKPLHAGLAARDAVMAVGLVRRGLTANEAILEARHGLFDLYGADPDDRPADGLGAVLADWWDGWLDDYAIKLYPSCYATHRPIDAALGIRETLASSGTVERVEVVVNRGALRPLLPGPPGSGQAAKFSLAYTVAVALTTGAVTLTDFTDEALQRADVRALMSRVTAREDDAIPGGHPPDGQAFAAVRAVTASGAGAWSTVRHTTGDSRRPLTPAQLGDKFTGCVRTDPQAGRGWAARLAGLVEQPTLAGAQTVLAGPVTPPAPHE